MQALFVNRLADPGDQLLHHARRVEPARRLEHHPDLPAFGVERDHVVAQGLVGAAVPLVLGAVAQQGEVELADMVLGQAQVVMGKTVGRCSNSPSPSACAT